MFNVGGGELIVIMLIALIVLGPTRLPGAARTAGRVMRDLRRLSSGFQAEVRDAFDDGGPDVGRRDRPGLGAAAVGARPLAAAVDRVDAVARERERTSAPADGVAEAAGDTQGGDGATADGVAEVAGDTTVVGATAGGDGVTAGDGASAPGAATAGGAPGDALPDDPASADRTAAWAAAADAGRPRPGEVAPEVADALDEIVTPASAGGGDEDGGDAAPAR